MNESAADGTYEVEITATAVSGEIRGTDTKKVTVINTAPIPVIPVLTCTTPSITLKKGGTIASLTVRSNVTPLEWLLSGELPEGLTYSIDGNKFVISGIVSQNSEARDYVYTVRAMNEVGISETLLITITVTVAASVTPNYIEAPAEEVSVMTNEEIKETFGGNENIVLTGETENLSEIISKLENLTEVKTLDCSNNSLLILNASGFKNLRSLESKHQRAIKPISRLMNFIDLLLGRGRFAVSAANEDSTYLENVKNLKAYKEIRGFGSSHGGCTLVFGAWALAVLMLLLVLISKTKTTK